MKVSIIVPVWNTEDYLRVCLDSLVNQTIDSKEIIIVNDGSPDNSEEIIKEYLDRYPELIKYIKKENGGLSSARNRALDVANGEYIGFVDSDDWIDLSMYEKMYNVAKSEKSDVVICDMVDHFPDGKIVEHDCTNYDLVFEKTPSSCNKIFRREFIGKSRFVEGGLWYEDLNFTTKLFLNTENVSVVHEGFYHCHAREGSIMNNNNSMKNLDIITCIDDIKNYAVSQEKFQENLFSYLIFNHILITTIMRVAKQKSKEKRRVIKTLVKYCKDNLGDYKNCDYYKKIDKNKKIIAILNYHGMYYLSNLLVSLKQYLKKNA